MQNMENDYPMPSPSRRAKRCFLTLFGIFITLGGGFMLIESGRLPWHDSKSTSPSAVEKAESRTAQPLIVAARDDRLTAREQQAHITVPAENGRMLSTLNDRFVATLTNNNAK